MGAGVELLPLGNAMRCRARAGKFYILRAAYERQMIEEAIRTSPTHTEAAKALGLQRTYMLRLMREFGIAGRTR